MISKDELQQHLDHVLTGTHFENLGQRRTGKVRDIYLQAEKIILIASDRYSAFDRNLALIPFKGQLLTAISNFWFEQTKDIVPNHVLDTPDPNVVVGKCCTMLPIEVVVRGYMTGVTGTSLWTLYQNGTRDFGDFTLPNGMKKNQKLDKPVITPTTKSDLHDMPITCKEIVAQGILPQDLWQQIEAVALALFKRGTEIAKSRGLILVDTKYEFGLDEQGRLTAIDEMHTPDSSRFWQMATYEGRIQSGLEPENFDKEFLRLWFKECCNPYQDDILPEAPADMIAELSYRYITLYEQITGKTFQPEFNDSIVDRISKNLSHYSLID
jgi:phosphoribosylaminoimidazole-succinocarboxamide synthase